MLKRTFVNLLLVFAILLTLGVSAVSGAQSAQEELTYTVKLGDNLWTLAEKYLGSGPAYHAIVAATNAKHGEDSSFANILDPGLIHPGWKLLIPGAEGEGEAEPEGPKGTLTVALSVFPNSIEMAQITEDQAANVAVQIFDMLLWMTEEGEVVPGLAESWDISEDETEYTFHLRDDVVFHNGEPFNADSVVLSWERASTSDFPLSYYWTMADSVEKIDDYTVKVTTPEPDALFLRFVALDWAMIPPKYYEEVGEEGFNEHPIGAGPFMFVEWVKGDHITLEANPNYWEGTPKIQTLIFRPVPESSTRIAAIQTGEVDVVQRLASEEAQSLMGAPNVNVISYPATGIAYIAFNNLTTGVGQPTEDPRVRMAMNYAVDVDAIIDALFDGHGMPASGLIAVGEMGYGVVEPFGYDLEKAKELLAEAGYADGFQMDMACPAGAFSLFEEVCEAVQGYLSEVGIETELEIMESGHYWDLEANKELPPLFGDIWPSGLGGEAYNRLNGSLRGWDAAYSAWSTPELVDLVNKIQRTTDFDERAKAYEEIQVMMQEDPPFIYLYQPMTFEAINTRIQNYRHKKGMYILKYASLFDEQ